MTGTLWLFLICVWSFVAGLLAAASASRLRDVQEQVWQLGADLAELGMQVAHTERVTAALAKRLPKPRTETGRLRKTRGRYMGRRRRPIEDGLDGDPTDAPGPVLVWFEIRDLDNHDAEVVQSYDDPGVVVDAWNKHEGRKRFRNVRITEGPDFRELKEVRAY